MKWNKFRLKTTTEAEDIVSSMLMDLGVQGIEIEDKIPMTQAEKEQMQGVETEELPLTVNQFAKVYEDMREWANTPGNMEEMVNPGLSISFINARYAYSGELDFGELTYVYSLSTRKITPLEGEYTGAKAYGVISGGYPMAFIFIDK